MYRNKYHNYGHGTSKAEQERGEELKLLQAAGQIKGLESQVRFDLLPSQKRSDGTTERGVFYKADFCYYDSAGEFIVEDVKGVETPDYIIKRKLMLFVHGITIQEVKAHKKRTL